MAAKWFNSLDTNSRKIASKLNKVAGICIFKCDFRTKLTPLCGNSTWKENSVAAEHFLAFEQKTSFCKWLSCSIEGIEPKEINNFSSNLWMKE